MSLDEDGTMSWGLFCEVVDKEMSKIGSNGSPDATLCRHFGCVCKGKFCYLDDSKARYCSHHRHPDMIHLICMASTIRECCVPGCENPPQKKIYQHRWLCFNHTIKHTRAMSHPVCGVSNCYERAYYCYRKHRAIKPLSHELYCVHHRTDNMLLIDAVRCQWLNCHNYPNYGDKKTMIATMCSVHKFPKMVRCRKML